MTIHEPAWRLQLSTTGDRPTTAIVYSKDLGFRILSVPTTGVAPSEQCIFETSLAGGELFVESLSWRRLVLVADAPTTSATMRLAGRGRVMRVYQNSDGAGIRTSWFRGWLTGVAAADAAEHRGRE